MTKTATAVVLLAILGAVTLLLGEPPSDRSITPFPDPPDESAPTPQRLQDGAGTDVALRAAGTDSAGVGDHTSEAPIVLAGTVVDAEGAPLEGMKLELMDADRYAPESGRRETISDAEGRFAFRGHWPRRDHIGARIVTQGASGHMLVAWGRRDIVVRARWTGTLVVPAIFPKGLPSTAVRLRVESSSYTESRHWIAGGPGTHTATMPEVDEGSHYVSLRVNGYQVRCARVSVQRGEVTTLPVTDLSERFRTVLVESENPRLRPDQLFLSVLDQGKSYQAPWQDDVIAVPRTGPCTLVVEAAGYRRVMIENPSDRVLVRLRKKLDVGFLLPDCPRDYEWVIRMIPVESDDWRNAFFMQPVTDSSARLRAGFVESAGRYHVLVGLTPSTGGFSEWEHEWDFGTTVAEDGFAVDIREVDAPQRFEVPIDDDALRIASGR